jgi:hypothetical protein
MPEQEILMVLETYNITYQLFKHDPIFSATEAEHIKTYISGAHTKKSFSS